MARTRMRISSEKASISKIGRASEPGTSQSAGARQPICRESRICCLRGHGSPRSGTGSWLSPPIPRIFLRFFISALPGEPKPPHSPGRARRGFVHRSGGPERRFPVHREAKGGSIKQRIHQAHLKAPDIASLAILGFFLSVKCFPTDAQAFAKLPHEVETCVLGFVIRIRSLG